MNHTLGARREMMVSFLAGAAVLILVPSGACHWKRGALRSGFSVGDGRMNT